MRTGWMLLTLLVLLAEGCYTLSGISIPEEVDTYFVSQFENNALNAPPTLPIEVTEALKEKIRTTTRLTLDDTNPHIEFQGTVVDFRVTAEAPQPGEFSAINRLTIVTAVEYINHLDEEAGFRRNFSYFFDFPATQDLSSVQEQAIQEILDQIMEDIFNQAFTDW
ncbi:MAG: hypothetical protein KDC54_05945 [Lewinella sp.]|nr:hypothetical protein [Lewinella sp.]